MNLVSCTKDKSNINIVGFFVVKNFDFFFHYRQHTYAD